MRKQYKSKVAFTLLAALALALALDALQKDMSRVELAKCVT
jgi:hypothetical protein